MSHTSVIPIEQRINDNRHSITHTQTLQLSDSNVPDNTIYQHDNNELSHRSHMNNDKQNSYMLHDYTHTSDHNEQQNYTTMPIHMPSPMAHSTFPFSAIDTVRSDDFVLHTSVNQSMFDRSSNVSPLPIPSTPQHTTLTSLLNNSNNDTNTLTHTHQHMQNIYDTSQHNNDNNTDASKRQYIPTVPISDRIVVAQPDAKRHRASEVDLSTHEPPQHLSLQYQHELASNNQSHVSDITQHQLNTPSLTTMLPTINTVQTTDTAHQQPPDLADALLFATNRAYSAPTYHEQDRMIAPETLSNIHHNTHRQPSVTATEPPLHYTNDVYDNTKVPSHPHHVRAPSAGHTSYTQSVQLPTLQPLMATQAVLPSQPLQFDQAGFNAAVQQAVVAAALPMTQTRTESVSSSTASELVQINQTSAALLHLAQSANTATQPSLQSNGITMPPSSSIQAQAAEANATALNSAITALQNNASMQNMSALLSMPGAVAVPVPVLVPVAVPVPTPTPAPQSDTQSMSSSVSNHNTASTPNNTPISVMSSTSVSNNSFAPSTQSQPLPSGTPPPAASMTTPNAATTMSVTQQLNAINQINAINQMQMQINNANSTTSMQSVTSYLPALPPLHPVQIQQMNQQQQQQQHLVAATQQQQQQYLQASESLIRAQALQSQLQDHASTNTMTAQSDIHMSNAMQQQQMHLSAQLNDVVMMHADAVQQKLDDTNMLQYSNTPYTMSSAQGDIAASNNAMAIAHANAQAAQHNAAVQQIALQQVNNAQISGLQPPQHISPPQLAQPQPQYANAGNILNSALLQQPDEQHNITLPITSNSMQQVNYNHTDISDYTTLHPTLIQQAAYNNNPGGEHVAASHSRRNSVTNIDSITSTITHPVVHEYSCEHCDQTFTDNQAYNKHVRSHKPKPYACENCDKTFTDQSKLKRHSLVHSKIRPFKCEYPGCDKAFALDFNLKAHIRVHTGEKPYVCKVTGCQSRFAQLNNLKAHMNTHKHLKHNEDATQQPPQQQTQTKPHDDTVVTAQIHESTSTKTGTAIPIIANSINPELITSQIQALRFAPTITNNMQLPTDLLNSSLLSGTTINASQSMSGLHSSAGMVYSTNTVPYMTQTQTGNNVTTHPISVQTNEAAHQLAYAQLAQAQLNDINYQLSTTSSIQATSNTAPNRPLHSRQSSSNPYTATELLQQQLHQLQSDHNPSLYTPPQR